MGLFENQSFQTALLILYESFKPIRQNTELIPAAPIRPVRVLQSACVFR